MCQNTAQFSEKLLVKLPCLEFAQNEYVSSLGHRHRMHGMVLECMFSVLNLPEYYRCAVREKMKIPEQHFYLFSLF